MTSGKLMKARVIRQYKEVNGSNAGIYWYKVIDETGKCRFESAYEDECLRFCEDPENNLQLEMEENTK